MKPIINIGEASNRASHVIRTTVHWAYATDGREMNTKEYVISFSPRKKESMNY